MPTMMNFFLFGAMGGSLIGEWSHTQRATPNAHAAPCRSGLACWAQHAPSPTLGPSRHGLGRHSEL